MSWRFRLSALAPKGLAVGEVLVNEAAVVITVRSAEIAASCPSRGVEARRTHSR